ncbi:unnamed protein product [Adineta steineri]|uniref:Uncharacterized protein n=1 Tax=Adineta steineri TaxID=433720 RepID=A0A819NYD9_9BILA|nr:unnamed protein product [Adineta steineri]CAF0826995.1 unnamed protein product [Adineta steineri]CAF4007241.1 unnamed protein product [Adineta steineri]CAF4171281.1 unnamed protein product [Adineta steineri]
MSSSTSATEINQNGLPDDIFHYNNDQFYNYILQSYGDDLAELFRFQAIRNGSHFLQALCDAILLILQQESDEIDKLRQICCFKINKDKYEIKLGVKLAINSLIGLLKVKQEEQQKKKKKHISTKRTSSNIDTLISMDETQSQDEMTTPTTITVSPVTDTQSTQSKLPLIQNRFNEIDHVIDIEQRINKWWCTFNNDNNLLLSEGTHFLLEINKSINDTYACILSCQCRNRFKLPFMTTGFFKLSAYFRHLKEKQCLTRSKAAGKKDNRLIINENSPANRSNSSSKRTRSPSKQATSNTNENILKKSKSLNNKHSDQD